ncbi:MAG: hypothetical protein AAGF57_18235 [Pseudomonadota bacterium]
MEACKEQVLPFRRYLFSLAIASSNDFFTHKQGLVDFDALWANKKDRISLYCIDFATQDAVFVETADPVNLTSYPFYYQAQRNHAKFLYRLAIDDFVQFSARLHVANSPVTLLFSTGRCGSTLMIKLLEASNQVTAFSEPDIFTQLALNTDIDSIKKAKIINAYLTLLKASISNEQSIIIKLRSQCTYDIKTYKNVPNIRSVYLYRDGLSFVNSYYSLLPTKLIALIKGLSLDSFLLNRPLINNAAVRNAPDLDNAKFNAIRPSLVKVFTLMWTSNIGTAKAMLNNSPDFFVSILHYRELKNSPIDACMQLTSALNISMPAEKDILAIMDENSQKGTSIASKGRFVLTQKDITSFEQIIDLHPDIDNSDVTL